MSRQVTSPLAPTTVRLNLDDRSYAIVVGAGTLDTLGQHVATAVGGNRPAAIITNPTVARHYLERVAASLRAATLAPFSIEIPDGEQYKSFASLTAIYDQLIAAHSDRGCPLVALGGGVIGDLTGLAAATYLRGVPYVQVPTTLLAQVDSSVGGKTAVNHPRGKNMIGAFYQPSLVLIDLDTLATLPSRELRAGLAEVIKYGAILDAELFALLERDLERLLALDRNLLAGIVRRCCEIKALVVERDERESEYRSILNFGHTLAHAVESATDFKRYLHGEAVAMGMSFAAQLSVARGYCEAVVMERIRNLLLRAALPVDLPKDVAANDLAVLTESDKKVSGGRIKFICIEDIGRARFEYLTVDEVRAVLVA